MIKCNTCDNFSHALEAMSDHVDFHTCLHHGGKIDKLDDAESCLAYKPITKKESK